MPLSPWMIALVTAVAAMLLRAGFRRHGWARFVYIVLAIAVLLWAVWYAAVKAGEQAENQLMKDAGSPTLIWRHAPPCTETIFNGHSVNHVQ